MLRPVAVQQLVFCRNGLKSGDRKCNPVPEIACRASWRDEFSVSSSRMSFSTHTPEFANLESKLPGCRSIASIEENANSEKPISRFITPSFNMIAHYPVNGNSAMILVLLSDPKPVYRSGHYPLSFSKFSRWNSGILLQFGKLTAIRC